MATTKNASRGQYQDVVDRLQELVSALEGGELTLEQSLERFAEGVQLVKQGEKLLSDAEKRIEQLLSEDGKTAPLKGNEAVAAAATPKPAKKAPRSLDDDEDDDVPF